MINRFLQKSNMVVVGCVIAVVLCLCRLAVAHFDPTYFVTAGSRYVNAAQTPIHTVVQPGEGYDGQFFYRLAQNPLNFSPTAYGITLDHPPYRVQRMGYPTLAYLFAFGGQPALVPWAMILVNLLSIGGIFLFTSRIVRFLRGKYNGWLPVLLFGLYMSLARDLSEITELFFFTGALYYAFRNNGWAYAAFATATLLTRDTSALAIAPLAGCLALRPKEDRKISLTLLALPFLLFAAWRAYVFYNLPSVEESMAGYHSAGLPFTGIILSFKINAHFDSAYHILQFGFWIAYLAWFTALAVIVIRNTSFAGLRSLRPGAILQVVTLVWIAFALCLTDIIYCDDWGFVRIFSLWSLTGLLSLSVQQKQTGSIFNMATLVLTALTLVRLIIRV